MTKKDPWYIHGILYAVIIILVLLLIKVAIIDPTEIVQTEKYYQRGNPLKIKRSSGSRNSVGKEIWKI